MKIACGHCSSFGSQVHHDSVAAVRACAEARRTTVLTIPTPAPAAPKARCYYEFCCNEATIEVVLQDRGTAGVAIPWGWCSQHAQHSRQGQQAAEAQRTPAPALGSTVPAGRYALEFDGTLRFFKVEQPTEGRWAGYTFVSEQASDDLHPVRGARRAAVLTALVKAGVHEALLRYGREIGSCGHCGRTLTDAASRAAGIGPVCAAKF